MPRLMGPAIRSGCHSAATLAAGSDGAFTRIEVPQMVHRPGSLILLNRSQPAHRSFSGNASSLKADAASGFPLAAWRRVHLNASFPSAK